MPATYILRSKRDDLFMRAIGFFYPKWMTQWWTTYRLPFCLAVITYPTHITDPRASPVFPHEMIHVEQLKLWWKPFCHALLTTVWPLPAIFSGRWLIERWAFLYDIRTGRHTIDSAIKRLWAGYFWPWPRFLMRRWFESRLALPASQDRYQSVIL